MLDYTYISLGKFELIDKPKSELQDPRDATLRSGVALSAYAGPADTKKVWYGAEYVS